MKPLYTYGVLVGGVLVGSLIAGCAQPNRQATVQCGNDYSCLSDMAFKYQREADQMTALAQRYEIEAGTMTDTGAAKQRRERAQAFWSQANQADELAHEYRSQLPHNMAH